MHQFDQFKQDMEKMSKAKLTNPIKSDKSKPERSSFDLTELNRQDILKSIRGDATVTNLDQFETSQTFTDCTVLTIDGIDGFAWIDQNGTRHDEGFVWPTMRIEQNCTVEVLTDEYGRESKGWYKQHGEEN